LPRRSEAKAGVLGCGGHDAAFYAPWHLRVFALEPVRPWRVCVKTPTRPAGKLTLTTELTQKSNRNHTESDHFFHRAAFVTLHFAFLILNFEF
jgi:hypothetical protein